MRAPMLCLALVLALVLAGCAEEGEPVVPEDDDFEDVEVDETTGGIRGVVVNDAIVPVADAKVVLDPDGEARATTTDPEGRFSFSKVAPGAHFLEVSKVVHETVQVSVVVEAGVATPPVLRVQLTRLYDQEPFLVPKQFQGYFTCAYNFFVSSTCVNDYTRINPTGHCPGGCFPELTRLLDNREYITQLEAEWKSIQIEMIWESSLAGTSDTMGMTVSYAARPTAGHWWFTGSGESPMTARLDFATHGGTPEQFHDKIPSTGLEDLFIFMSAGEGQVSIEQDFEIFHHESYYAPLPEDWSFVRGDEPPF